MAGEAVSAEQMPYWRLVTSQTLITQEVLEHKYTGAGTDQDPFLVEFLDHDARNPMRLSKAIKWMIAVLMALGTLS